MDRCIETARDLPVHQFQPPGAGSLRVQIGGKSRSVESERLKLVRQSFLAPIGLAPAFEGSLKRIERQG